MKRFAVLSLGVLMLTFAAGCYCGPGGCYMPNYFGGGYGGYGGGYGGGYYGGACPGGNCGVAPGGVPLGVSPQGAVPNYNSVHTGYPGTISGPVAVGPAAQPLFGIPQMAVAPLEPLPTY